MGLRIEPTTEAAGPLDSNGYRKFYSEAVAAFGPGVRKVPVCAASAFGDSLSL